MPPALQNTESAHAQWGLCLVAFLFFRTRNQHLLGKARARRGEWDLFLIRSGRVEFILHALQPRFTWTMSKCGRTKRDAVASLQSKDSFKLNSKGKETVSVLWRSSEVVWELFPITPSRDRKLTFDVFWRTTATWSHDHSFHLWLSRALDECVST